MHLFHIDSTIRFDFCFKCLYYNCFSSLQTCELVFLIQSLCTSSYLHVCYVMNSFARISSTKIPSWRLEQASVVAGIFSTLSVKDQQLVHDYIRYNPWLQVCFTLTWR